MNRLGRQETSKINSRLMLFIESKPANFSRRPRAITKFCFWKATEFRTFLLYTGPLVLRGFLPQPLYNNFMERHVAVTILVIRNLIQGVKFIDRAEELLNSFVQNFQKIYGKEYTFHIM